MAAVSTVAFADVEELVIAGLSAAAGTDAVSTSTPDQLEDHLPFRRVTAGPGSDDGITDRVLVDVETFAADRGSARDLAEADRVAVLALAGTAPLGDGRLIDDATTAARPQVVSFGNPAVVRVVASYWITQRRPRARS